MQSSSGLGLAFLLFLIIIGGGVWLTRKDREQLCLQMGGVYNTKHRECSDISEPDCDEIVGKWIECGSSCRHIKGELCNEKCESYCQL